MPRVGSAPAPALSLSLSGPREREFYTIRNGDFYRRFRAVFQSWAREGGLDSSCLRVFARERRPRQRQTQRELGIDATAEMQMQHRYQRMSRRFTSVRRGGLAVVHRALPVPFRSHGPSGIRPLPKEDLDANLLIFLPKCFEDAGSDALAALGRGKTVLMNLNFIDQLAEQQRVLDFVTGGCVALGGSQCKVADGVVIFAPKNVRVKEVERARASSLAAAAGNEKDDKSFFGFSSDDVTWTWEE